VNRCRRVEIPLTGVETGGGAVPRDEGRGEPEKCSTGARHEGGVNKDQASARNVRTCRPDAKGRSPSGRNRKGQSTDAGHGGGGARSRDEGSVMGLDRRGTVVRPEACSPTRKGMRREQPAKPFPIRH
jgi:hypothetical protein